MVLESRQERRKMTVRKFQWMVLFAVILLFGSIQAVSSTDDGEVEELEDYHYSAQDHDYGDNGNDGDDHDEDHNDDEGDDVNDDGSSWKTIASRPTLDGKAEIKILELSDGSRAMAFGDHDFQTMTKDFDVVDDALVDDIDYYIRGYLVAFGYSSSFATALESCTAAPEQAIEITHRALMFGLGGGTMARIFSGRFLFMHTTVVEIEPAVVELAQEYFNVKPGPRLEMKVADIREYLNATSAEDKFDFIFHDGCDSDGFIEELHTVEFLQSLKAHLKDDGVLSVNLVFLDPTLKDASSILIKALETYKQVFGFVSTLCLDGGHTIVYARNLPITSNVEVDAAKAAVVKRMKLIDPLIDYEKLFRSADLQVESQPEHAGRCTAMFGDADPIMFTVRNHNPRAVDIYWDEDPVRFITSCAKYPFKRNILRSMRKQSALQPQKAVKITAYHGHVFVAVDAAKRTVVDCITITKTLGSEPDKQPDQEWKIFGVRP